MQTVLQSCPPCLSQKAILKKSSGECLDICLKKSSGVFDIFLRPKWHSRRLAWMISFVFGEVRQEFASIETAMVPCSSEQFWVTNWKLWTRCCSFLHSTTIAPPNFAKRAQHYLEWMDSTSEETCKKRRAKHGAGEIFPLFTISIRFFVQWTATILARLLKNTNFWKINSEHYGWRCHEGHAGGQASCVVTVGYLFDQFRGDKKGMLWIFMNDPEVDRTSI